MVVICVGRVPVGTVGDWAPGVKLWVGMLLVGMVGTD